MIKRTFRREWNSRSCRWLKNNFQLMMMKKNLKMLGNLSMVKQRKIKNLYNCLKKRLEIIQTQQKTSNQRVNLTLKLTVQLTLLLANHKVKFLNILSKGIVELYRLRCLKRSRMTLKTIFKILLTHKLISLTLTVTMKITTLILTLIKD